MTSGTRVLDFEKPIVELEGKIRELKLLLAGGNEDMAKEMYRYLAIANYEDRFVIPTSKEEMRLEDYHGFQGQAGFSFGSASSVGISPNSLFPERRKESMEPRKPVPHADEMHDVTGERY